MDAAGLALVITSIGTITTPIVVAYFAWRGRRDLEHESDRNLTATAEVHQEVRTLNESTLGQLGADDETRRIEAKQAAGESLTPKEERHISAAEESQ